MKETEVRLNAIFEEKVENRRDQFKDSPDGAKVRALEGIEDCLELIAELIFERDRTQYLMQGKNGERLTESIAELEGRDNPELSAEAETYIAVTKLEREFDKMLLKVESIAQMVGLLMERDQKDEDTATIDLLEK